METTIAVTKKRVFGQVEFNDGCFAEIQTFGIEGVEKGILLARQYSSASRRNDAVGRAVSGRVPSWFHAGHHDHYGAEASVASGLSNMGPY